MPFLSSGRPKFTHRPAFGGESSFMGRGENGPWAGALGKGKMGLAGGRRRLRASPRVPARPRASLRCAPAAAGGSRFSRAPGGARLGPGPLPPPLVPAAAFCRSSRRGSPSPRDGRPARRAASPRLAAAGGIKRLLSAVRLGGSAPPPRARSVGGGGKRAALKPET